MRFLLATDGSGGAAAATGILRRLPLSSTDEVTLLTVVQQEEGREEAWAILETAHNALQETGATLRRQIRRGNVAVEIIDNIVWTAEEGPTDLIVIGGRGMHAVVRFFIGSVAERVAEYAPCSVLVARPASETTPIDRVVVGYDGSKGARLCLSFLQRLPLPPEAQITLVAVVPPRAGIGFLPPALNESIRAIQLEEKQAAKKALDAAITELQQQGRQAKAELREGDPAASLIDAAKANDADVIVVSAARSDDPERFLLGSVSEKVTRQAPCSVLVVRPQKRWQ